MKKWYLIGSIFTICFTVAFIFQNCGGYSSIPASENASKTSEDQIDDLHKLIVQLNALDLRCTQDSDCSAIALGSKGCGGPNGYLVASTLSEKHEEILALADELERKESEYNQSTGLVSDCMYLMPPEVKCELNICKAAL